MPELVRMGTKFAYVALSREHSGALTTRNQIKWLPAAVLKPFVIWRIIGKHGENPFTSSYLSLASLLHFSHPSIALRLQEMTTTQCEMSSNLQVLRYNHHVHCCQCTTCHRTITLRDELWTRFTYMYDVL